MHTQHFVRRSLAGALALAAFGFAAVAAAQAAPPASGQFEQGTQSSATFPLPDSHGGTLTVNSGMPATLPSYGPWPAFKTLDKNHDGRISAEEAKAYVPLENDFLQVSGGAKFITKSQYQAFVKANPQG